MNVTAALYSRNESVFMWKMSEIKMDIMCVSSQNIVNPLYVQIYYTQ